MDIAFTASSTEIHPTDLQYVELRKTALSFSPLSVVAKIQGEVGLRGPFSYIPVLAWLAALINSLSPSPPDIINTPSPSLLGKTSDSEGTPVGADPLWRRTGVAVFTPRLLLEAVEHAVLCACVTE